MWTSFVLALLTGCLCLGTRFVSIDLQTGTPLAISLDQGAAIVVLGDVPMDASLEVTGHDSDQDVWQWWFASYPHSLIVPLWAPLMIVVALGLVARGAPAVRAPCEAPPGSLTPTPAH
jgi:hypothetical protein